MGAEKEHGELILQIELNNPELAMNKVRIMERSFKTLLAQEAYHNVKGYLQLLKKLIEDPYLLEQPFLWK